MERVIVEIKLKRGSKTLLEYQLNPRTYFEWQAPVGMEIVLEDGSLLKNLVFVSNVVDEEPNDH